MACRVKSIQSTATPIYGQRFWHKEYNEYCYFVKVLPSGSYLCGLNPRLRDDDDYYAYEPKELKLS